MSSQVRQSRVLDSFPEYFRLAFRLLAGNLTAETDQLIAGSHCLDLSLTPDQQQEADFASIFHLCAGGGAEGSLEKEFWLFIIVLFYMEVLRRKNYFSSLHEDRRKETEDTMSQLLFRIIKVGAWKL